MDPFTLLAGSLLGAAMVSSASSDREGVSWSEIPDLWQIFNLSPWHFARSWDWEPYIVTVRATDLSEAAWLVHKGILDKGGNPEDVRYRTYAVVKGGHEVSTSTAALVPAGAPVVVIWQAERCIQAISVRAPMQMSVNQAINLAWTKVDPNSECWHYAWCTSGSESGSDVKPYCPDMVVIGGEIVFVGDL